MASVCEKSTNHIKQNGGGRYANQKQTNRKETENLLNIESAIKYSRAHAKRWQYNQIFNMNWVTLEWVSPATY